MSHPQLPRSLTTKDALDDFVRWRVIRFLLASALFELKDAKLPLPEIAKTVDAALERVSKHLELIAAINEAIADVFEGSNKNGSARSDAPANN